MKWTLLALFVVAVATVGVATSDSEKIYRMCVPAKYYQDCLNVLKDPSEAGIRMECVEGRDRIDCLDLINQRKADVLASEPEDMYVAYHTKNDDYRVISEIRTQADKNADFRYEGIILVKKNSNIHSLKELRNTKSCHTGFGRNVGFKIPVTKLKNAHILKVSMDAQLTATERELKALSEFFSESCLVGTYSPYPETDTHLKRKYPNLCALCEKPEQCNYPDKYSGYDGAIRCLDKGNGDVAFTKVQFIKKYFGLEPGTKAEGDPTEFEYLCEDGSRRAINGSACSWAQRPWTGYLSNVDAVNGDGNLHNLQARLERFFANGLHAENKEAAAHLLINPDAVYHSKAKAVEPQEYLERAGYKDVIERDGSAIRKLKMCVRTDAELSKCNTMRRAAYSRDIRPEIECVQQHDCLEAVKTQQADLLAITADGYKLACAEHLKPIVYEGYGDDNVYVAVVDAKMTPDDIMKASVHYDGDDVRARKAATFLNKRRNLGAPEGPSSEMQLSIVHSSKLDQHKDKMLLCPNMERKPPIEVHSCNFEANLPTAIFIRDNMTPVEQETIKHLFVSLSSKFGRLAKLSDVFMMFGKYHRDQANVLFDDDAVEFVTDVKNVHEQIYSELHCDRSDATKKVVDAL